jgi:2-polyprenyl-6-methoxyphenol hydroxylase-like FAD-dependent oxidoreductase
MDTHVLVVGAGPTGLLLAAELRRRSVDCELVDALEERNHWDRATVIHPRSLELLESLGLAGRFLDAGVPVRTIRIHSDGAVLGELDLTASGSSYGFNVGLSEEVTEDILTEYLHSQGGSVARGSRLVGLEPGADAVTATIEHHGERRDVTAPWLVGCDGFHSPTRTLAGIGFEGPDIEDPWAVFDAGFDGWPAEYDATFVFLDAPPVILTALPDRRWRVYLRPGSPTVDLVDEAARVVRRYAPGASAVDVENPTRFRCHAKVARPYRAGRVLVAGDAAHVCSPSEGHGMNSGMQDAANLAWKLALVCRGAVGPELLDSYEAERRPVAVKIVESGQAVERSQMAAHPAERTARDEAVRAMTGDPASRHAAILAEVELDIDYPDSPVVTGDRTRPGPGDRLPGTVPVHASGGHPCRLHELTHRSGHTVLVLADQTVPERQVTGALRELREATAGSPVFETVVALSAGSRPPDHVGRIDAGVTEMLGVDGIAVIAVRPDQYIGFRRDRVDPSTVSRYLALLHA